MTGPVRRWGKTKDSYVVTTPLKNWYPMGVSSISSAKEKEIRGKRSFAEFSISKKDTEGGEAVRFYLLLLTVN